MKRFGSIVGGRLFKTACAVSLMIGCCSTPCAVRAQEFEVRDVERAPSIELVLTPTAAPEPMLKYEFLPSAIDQTAGNAATHYGKVKAEQNAFFSNKEVWKLIDQARSAPLSELRHQPEYAVFANLGGIYANMKRGARCRNVDWQLPIGEEYYANILLPEVQESRSFVRLLQARARVRLAQGDFEGAIDTIQTGLALARHVGRGETLINGLVGVAGVNGLMDVVQEMIALPDCPNMYWALACLPTPLIETRAGLESERFALFWTERAWLAPEKLEGDEHFWRRELERLWGYLSNAFDRPADQSMLTSYVVRGYPIAKQRLVTRGFKADEVENMPVPKVILLDALHQYRCNSDRQFLLVQQALSDPSRLAAMNTAEPLAYPESLPITRLLGLITPGMIPKTILLCQRRVAMLQTVEAIRMYAAVEGKLPTQLSDVTLVYLPPDPASKQPFDYQLKDGKAMLSCAQLDQQTFKLELSLR